MSKKFTDYGPQAVTPAGDTILWQNAGVTNSNFQTKTELFAQILSEIGGLDFQGTWNADTNTPTLASSTGTKGEYFIVSVAGSTNLDGITDWQIGDFALFSGSVWQKVDNTDSVSTVFGRVGNIVATNGDYSISQITNGLSDALASASIFVGNVSNVATAVTMSGQATINNAGAVTLTGSPLFSGLQVGTTATQDGTLHVHKASAAGTASTLANLIVAEDNTSNGFSVLVPGTSGIRANLFLGNPANPDAFKCQWSNFENLGTIGTNKTNSDVRIVAGAGLEAIRIRSDLFVAIGTAIPTTLFNVVGDLAGDIGFFFNDGGTDDRNGIKIQGGLDTNPTTAMDFITFADGNGTEIGFIEGDGAGGVQLNGFSSDRDVKTNIVDTQYGLGDLVKIKIVDFNYKKSETMPQVGIIAQDLFDVFPEAVNQPTTIMVRDPNDKEKQLEKYKPWNINYIKVVPLIIKSVQDLKNEKDSEIAELRGRLDELEAA